MGDFIFPHERLHTVQSPILTSDPTQRLGQRGIGYRREACDGLVVGLKHANTFYGTSHICRPHRQHLRRFAVFVR